MKDRGSDSFLPSFLPGFTHGRKDVGIVLSHVSVVLLSIPARCPVPHWRTGCLLAPLGAMSGTTWSSGPRVSSQLPMGQTDKALLGRLQEVQRRTTSSESTSERRKWEA